MPTGSRSKTIRRPGYAPSNPAVGRRGKHTRERILSAAAELFAGKGFHSVTVDEIAQTVGGSRALVYQYFSGTDAIFGELARECEPVMLDHGRRFTGLGPHAAGVHRLRKWLHEWEVLYDRYATVLLEFPGIGPVAGRPRSGAGVLSTRYTRLIGTQLETAGAQGLDTGDTAAAMLRVAHMTNLYRYRRVFELPAGAAFSDSLAVALQLLLFPDTPPAAIAAAIPDHGREVALPSRRDQPGPKAPDDSHPVTRRDILRASATLITENGYYAVGMPDIRARAGVSRATLYRYFSTKMDILSELSAAAVAEGATLSAELADLAQNDPTPQTLHAWLCRYVNFHRRFGGIVRAWYDGTLREHLAEDIAAGVTPFRDAALRLLSTIGLPERMDPAVGATVFLAVLGRTSDIAVTVGSDRTDGDAADFMMTILRRSLLRDW